MRGLEFRLYISDKGIKCLRTPHQALVLLGGHLLGERNYCVA
jgi:hypothetical protein